MVRRQREKQYQSSREHREHSQIRSGSANVGSSVQRQLPFSHCALSLTAFETPVCNRDGIVFENTALFPFIMKHKMDPVSGAPMESRDIITLNMAKDEEGRWQCPVLTKPFADHSKILAILQPGGDEANVISYEAYHELNVKTKQYEDLITGVQFDKHNDVLVLNDPGDDDLNRRRDIHQFYHILHSRELQSAQASGSDVRHSVTATRVMEKLKKNAKEASDNALVNPSVDDNRSNELLFIDIDGEKVPIMSVDVTGVEFTTGKCSVSLTSSASSIANDNVPRQATLEEVLQSQFRTMRKLKKKGYVVLETNMGNITVELHCDMAPRTCVNFLGLCKQRKYDDTTCHRLIKSFMVQFGSPPKGQEEESLWGDAFQDEFDDRLSHTGEGVLSMANAGLGTNRRQFFITFQSCPHLDRKHSVFGKVIKGMEVVKKMEAVPTDKKERPLEQIKILNAIVQEDPAEEARNLDCQRIEKLIRDRRKVQSSNSGSDAKVKSSGELANTPSIGKYLSPTTTGTLDKDQDITPAPRLAPPAKKTKFGNFSEW